MSLTIETVEMHTGGEAVRLIVAGYPPVPGSTILAKRRHAREHLDRYRKLIMFEPRGHYDMYGVLPVEPDLPGADLAVLFMHNEGYSTMCGHAVIALARYAVDSGRVAKTAPESRVAIQCPCGLVEAKVAADGSARFRSVPAFAFALDARIDAAGPGHRLKSISAMAAPSMRSCPRRASASTSGTPGARPVDAASAVTRGGQGQIRAASILTMPISPSSTAPS